MLQSWCPRMFVAKSENWGSFPKTFESPFGLWQATAKDYIATGAPGCKAQAHAIRDLSPVISSETNSLLETLQFFDN